MAHAPIVFEMARAARCSPETVLSVMRDPREWPNFQPEILTASGPAPLTEDDVVEGEAKMMGFHVSGRSRTVTVDSGIYEEDVIVGVRMRISYRVEPTGRGVVITRRLTADLPRGVLGAVLSFFLRRRLRMQEREVLELLVARCEAL